VSCWYCFWSRPCYLILLPLRSPSIAERRCRRRRRAPRAHCKSYGCTISRLSARYHASLALTPHSDVHHTTRHDTTRHHTTPHHTTPHHTTPHHTTPHHTTPHHTTPHHTPPLTSPRTHFHDNSPTCLLFAPPLCFQSPICLKSRFVCCSLPRLRCGLIRFAWQPVGVVIRDYDAERIQGTDRHVLVRYLLLAVPCFSPSFFARLRCVPDVCVANRISLSASESES
jgi:hypothetical protein